MRNLSDMLTRRRMSFSYTEQKIDGLRLRVGVRRPLPGATREFASHPALLMLNGVGSNAELLERLADALPGRLIVAPDMPGCGGSPDPCLPYSMPGMAATMLALMRQFVPDDGASFDVLGFSWGGALAQQIAVQAPSRLRRLVLVSTTAGLPLPVGDPGAIARLLDPREYADPKRMRVNFDLLLLEGGAGAGLMQRLRTPTPLGLSYQLAALATWTAAPLLPLLSMPVLLVTTADDPIVPPAHHRVLSWLIPKARVHVIAGGGHLAPLSRPEKLSGQLLSFLDQEPVAMRASA